MSGRLLGGFDNAMAGLSADDVERETASLATDRHDVHPGAHFPPDQVSTEFPTDVTLADVRSTDPRPADLARRLLGLPVNNRAPARAALRFIPITGGSEVQLDDSFCGPLVIGRANGGVGDTGCQLVIDRSVVSRRHCQVVLVPGGFGLIDLGAANATGVVRNALVHHVTETPFHLQPGDIISTIHGESPMVIVEAVNP